MSDTKPAKKQPVKEDASKASQPADSQAGSLMGMGGTSNGQVGKSSMGEPGVLSLQSVPNGTVRVWRNAQGKLEAQIDVYGLTPGSAHTVTIDGPNGTAADPEVRLGAFTATSAGQANVTLTATSNAAVLRSGSRLGIHLGSYTSSPGANPLAEEVISQSASLATRPAGELAGLHPRSFGITGSYLGRLHGWAKIVYSPGAHALSVTVTAFGLAPGAHAAHIHTGSCQVQGPVKYMLMDFQADAHGNVVNQTRTVSGVTSAPPTSGWYLNLHLGNSGDILANGMPTLDFRPELCANIGGAGAPGSG